MKKRQWHKIPLDLIKWDYHSFIFHDKMTLHLITDVAFELSTTLDCNDHCQFKEEKKAHTTHLSYVY